MAKLNWKEDEKSKGGWIAWLPGIDASSLGVVPSKDGGFYWCSGLEEGRAPTANEAKDAAEESISQSLRRILLILDGEANK